MDNTKQQQQSNNKTYKLENKEDVLRLPANLVLFNKENHSLLSIVSRRNEAEITKLLNNDDPEIGLEVKVIHEGVKPLDKKPTRLTVQQVLENHELALPSSPAPVRIGLLEYKNHILEFRLNHVMQTLNQMMASMAQPEEQVAGNGESKSSIIAP